VPRHIPLRVLRPSRVCARRLPGRPSTETTITAAELCTAGIWERVDGGYRVLNWEAAKSALTGYATSGRGPARPRLGPGTPGPRPRPDGQGHGGSLRRARNAEPPRPASSSWPGHLPAEWDQWPSRVHDSIIRQREPGQWYLLFKGVAAYNGYGDPIDTSRAGRIAQAFRPPLCFAQVHTAAFYDDAGFCQDCDAPYCYRHWHVSKNGYGYCPRRPARAWIHIGRPPQLERPPRRELVAQRSSTVVGAGRKLFSVISGQCRSVGLLHFAAAPVEGG
jgi:hypothetical protein